MIFPLRTRVGLHSSRTTCSSTVGTRTTQRKLLGWRGWQGSKRWKAGRLGCSQRQLTLTPFWVHSPNPHRNPSNQQNAPYKDDPCRTSLPIRLRGEWPTPERGGVEPTSPLPPGSSPPSITTHLCCPTLASRLARIICHPKLSVMSPARLCPRSRSGV